MKLLKIVFSFLTIIFLLFSVAIFIAGSLIFLNIQLYNQIYQLSGFWIAFLTILLEIVIFFYVASVLIENMFHNIFDWKKSSGENPKENKGLISKQILFSVIIYELFKLLCINKSRK